MILFLTSADCFKGVLTSVRTLSAKYVKANHACWGFSLAWYQGSKRRTRLSHSAASLVCCPWSFKIVKTSCAISRNKFWYFVRWSNVSCRFWTQYKTFLYMGCCVMTDLASSSAILFPAATHLSWGLWRFLISSWVGFRPVYNPKQPGCFWHANLYRN